MSWIYLIIAGLLEVGWAVGLKYTEGFTRLVPSVLTLVAMTGSVLLLGLALRSLPLGTAYMIWTGIGALGAFAVGVAFLGEGLSVARLIAAGLILAGLVLMKLSAQA